MYSSILFAKPFHLLLANPPHPDVADRQSEKLPESADIVIIGSGMSGTSIAWHLLMDNKSNSTKVPRIAMLEARQACSGATGRNGGHIRPSSYEEYVDAKKVTTQEQAAKITKFRANHVDALIGAANKLPAQGAGRLEEPFAEAVRQWETLKKEVPEVGNEWGVLQRDEAVRISLMPDAVGALTGTAKVAGAIWGYRFVTNSLKMLLDTYPKSLSLDTHTTATAVTATSKNSTHNFAVTTDRGTILANHVVYATNSWSPHFVPMLGDALAGGLLSMSAHLGGAGLPKPGAWPAYHNNVSLPGGRAWSLFLRGGLDYIVQNPENGEYMFGGGAGIPEPENINQYDDSVFPAAATASYLNGALPTYFGYQNWGAERTDFPADLHQDVIYPGRTKRVWTGVEGFTTDAFPFVGPLSQKFTNRAVKNRAAGGEWVSAGFNGEGMDYAWLSGKGLSEMIRNHMANATNEPLYEWFPQAFLPTQERLRKQNSTSVARRDVDRSSRWV
ncbi:FAD dependent oxidoreductase [Apiospora rasikravindrae]|uniref:FAD dependent oxidoreductase n=1 Tax=Apiospora rasikravindrae TaxID=990691 RepID=A0ABR1TW37_9PEZI